MTTRSLSTVTPYSPAYWMAADRRPFMRPIVRAWRMHVTGREHQWFVGSVVAVSAFSVAMLAFRWALLA